MLIEELTTNRETRDVTKTQRRETGSTSICMSDPDEFLSDVDVDVDVDADADVDVDVDVDVHVRCDVLPSSKRY